MAFKFHKPYYPAILWSILIASSCLLPRGVFPVFNIKSLFQFDKLVHFILFFMLIILWLFAMESKGVLNHKTKIFTLIICIIYGILIEYIQLAMAVGRSMEVGDIIADAMGAILGLLLLKQAKKWLTFISKRLPFVNQLYKPIE